MYFRLFHNCRPNGSFDLAAAMPALTPIPSVLGASAAVTSPSRRSCPTPPTPSITVWEMTQLTSFHQGGGDVIVGKGSCASVHLFRHQETGTPMALKVFALPTNNRQALAKKMAIIRREASI
mgnify:CR=1 FL=1